MPHSDKPVPSLTPQITTQGSRQLSQLQLQFNQKVEQVEQLKQEIVTCKASVEEAQKRVEKELRPIIELQLEKRVELVKLLDDAYAFPVFSYREKEKLALLITEIAYDLIAKYEREDMIELHDKYAELSYEERLALVEEYPEDLEHTFEGDEADLQGEPEDLDDYERIQAQLDLEQEQREQEKQHRQKNRKIKAQLAKEAQAKAELNNISKASRRVYTALAKQLHPDKEQDATIRAWKDEAMKKVTQAYHQDDFFELLRLQMEFMQEYGQALDKLPEDQLQYYVQLLTDQVNELKQELYDIAYAHDATFYNRFCGTPKQMDQKFKAAKEDLIEELERLKQHLRTLEDPYMIRLLLK